MTPLRQRMLEDMGIRNFTKNTQSSYLTQVCAFAKHFGQSPDELGPDEIRSWQLHLLNVKKLTPQSISMAASALRFLYKVTLKREWAVEEIPLPKQPFKLPVILSREEVTHFFECIGSLKHRTILMAAYAGGLRISEVTRLKISDIDSQRMTLFVELGKGQKDRYVMLSPQLLEILRHWWRVARPEHWLFPGAIPGQPISRGAVNRACQKAHRMCGIRKTITPHSLRHALPRTFWNLVPTYEQSSCCSVTAAWPRHRITSRLPPARCARRPVHSICCHVRPNPCHRLIHPCISES